MHNYPDPRGSENFDPAFLPLCDGAEVPAPTSDEPQVRKIIEFAAVYYAMNQAVTNAAEARVKGDFAAETAALADLREASHVRDALEDRYAPEGFLAEPLMRGSQYENLVFSWAGKPAPQPVLIRRFEVEFSL